MALFKSDADLCDVVSIAVYCGSDSSMMLSVDNSNEHWIPSIRVPEGQSWFKIIAKEVQEIFGGFHPNKILRLWKTYVPHLAQTSLMHCVFALSVDANGKNKSKATMGKYRGKLRWVTETDLSKLCSTYGVKSPELMELFYLFKKTALPGDYVLPDDFIFRQNFAESSDDVFVSPKGGNIYSQLVDASGIDRIAQESLLKEFIFMCFPANYMGLRDFTKFVFELGWAKENAPFIFRAADPNNRNGLSFREFLYFLATVDPNTVHGGAAAEIRCKYMFKYYDRDKDNLLKPEELKNMIIDLRRTKKQPIDPSSVAKDASDVYKSMGVGETTALNLSTFLKAVSDLKIRGTSTVFRSSVGILKYLKDLGNRGGQAPAPAVTGNGRPGGVSSGGGGGTDNYRGKMTAPSLKTNVNYEVAVHTVKIEKSGEAIDIDEMKTLREAMSMTTMKQPYNEQSRKISLDIFSQRSVTNELLKGVRYLTSINKIKDPKANYSWGQMNSSTFGRNVITVCQQVRDIFRGERRLLELSSPAYIMGDFHGNVADLLYFEKILWHIGPGLCPCTLLFLGDYVDRGAYSIEVMSYLMCYKLQYPKKVNLLRGNHEIRDVQKMFTFQKECILKFGDKLGNEVWVAMNNAFDTMPLAATIDAKLFCCHGGVPPPWLCPVISAINDIPVPLNQPDTQSSLAWELMWNDPVRPKGMNDKLAMELLANEGFAVNQRRGTAHIFNVEALERFLKANQLTHLVRAHEVAQAGFQVLQKGKLLTVFSSSKYCGGLNDAACVMVDQEKLRILRLAVE